MEDKRIYYVYKHYIDDPDKPFYIGVGIHVRNTSGKIVNGKSKYNRAYKIHNHGDWVSFLLDYNNIFNYEIVYDNLLRHESYNLEKELINKYGRKDNGTGILVNKTNGGGGSVGYLANDTTRKKIAEFNRKYPIEECEKYYRLKNKLWYENNKDRICKLKKDRISNIENYYHIKYLENQDYYKEYAKNNYLENQDYYKEYTKNYYNENKDKFDKIKRKQYLKEYNKNNRIEINKKVKEKYNDLKNNNENEYNKRLEKNRIYRRNKLKELKNDKIKYEQHLKNINEKRRNRTLLKKESLYSVKTNTTN